MRALRAHAELDDDWSDCRLGGVHESTIGHHSQATRPQQLENDFHICPWRAIPGQAAGSSRHRNQCTFPILSPS